MQTNLTVDEIDALYEISIKEWKAANGGLSEVHRYVARAVERRLLGDRAALNEEIITLQAALSGRHEDVARLTIRVGQLEEALRQAGLGKAALEARTPAAPVTIGAGDPEAVFADFCDREGYPSDGEMDGALRDAFYEGIKYCCVTPAAPVVAEGLTKPTAYICPAGCGCMWRDNGDGTMSLFDGNQKSCAVCEAMPLAKLDPMRIADHLFIDARQDGYWHVCVEKVCKTEDEARAACRRWTKATAAHPVAGSPVEAEPYGWVVSSPRGTEFTRGEGNPWVPSAGAFPVYRHPAPPLQETEGPSVIGKLLDAFSEIEHLWGLNEPGALVRHRDVFNMIVKIGKEQAQREKMQQKFASRTVTPATADFDLPAPNDAAEPMPASEAAKCDLTDYRTPTVYRNSLAAPAAPTDKKG